MVHEKGVGLETHYVAAFVALDQVALDRGTFTRRRYHGLIQVVLRQKKAAQSEAGYAEHFS